MRLLLAGIAALACSGCATVEDTIERHPVITTVATVAVTAAVTTVIANKLAKQKFDEQVRQAEGQP